MARVLYILHVGYLLAKSIAWCDELIIFITMPVRRSWQRCVDYQYLQKYLGGPHKLERRLSPAIVSQKYDVISFLHHWLQRAVNLTTLSSLMAPQIIVRTPYGATRQSCQIDNILFSSIMDWGRAFLCLGAWHRLICPLSFRVTSRLWTTKSNRGEYIYKCTTSINYELIFASTTMQSGTHPCT